MLADASRPHVVRHDSAVGRWELASGAAAPPLRPYVRGYLGTSSRIGFLRERHLPSGDVALIINFGAPHRLIDAGDATRSTEHRTAWVIGLHERYALTEAAGARQFMVVRFTPIGAHLFLGLPMNALTNRAVELDDITGTQAHRLVAQLHDAPSWAHRFAILDSVIAARVARARAPSLRTAWAWRRLDETAGGLEIGALAAQLGWSRKHLIAQFHEQIGLAPKGLARILRFNRAVRLLERADDVRWVEIAYDCGYYDQAHFIKDFRTFAGSTPSEYLGRRLPDSAGRVRD